MSITCVEDFSDQHALNQSTKWQHQERDKCDQKPEVDIERAKRHGCISADGIELAMAHIDDVEKAENNGEAKRNKNDGNTKRQSVQHLRRKDELDIINRVHASSGLSQKENRCALPRSGSLLS